MSLPMDAWPYSTKPPRHKPQQPVTLARLEIDTTVDPAGYLPDEGLADAVNVALLLGQPLLVTGEPGSGKSQLAFSVAWQLGLPAPLVFETKSTSLSRDLFYVFDNLSRFQAAHDTSRAIDPRHFIEYTALGLAILRSRRWEDVQQFVSPMLQHDEPTRSVVLIDEIDKAPRDFPNDILNEIDRLYFRIPELGVQVEAASDLKPIVIMTSNSEKALPDPFLRRCIYYHIPFPDSDRLEQIVLSRIAGLSTARSEILSGTMAFFDRLRHDSSALRKKPGTAELLNWCISLVEWADVSRDLRRQEAAVARTLSALAKTPEDQEKVAAIFRSWVAE